MKTFLVAMLFPFLAFADMTPASVIQSVNAQRQQNGLASLTVSAKLTQIAMLRAYDMSRTHEWTHTPSDRLDYIALARFKEYRWTSLGENLATGFYDTETETTAWMHSPEHLANILGNYAETGTAVYGGYVVELFGLPK